MPHQVTIKPSDHAFTAQDDEKILDAALREGFVIPYGCRNGACGTCKGKVLEGHVDYGSYQETALSEAEKRQGLALFCQARPRGDVVIECREISAAKDIRIKSMIEHAFHAGVTRPIVLYWGGRVRADLYLTEPPERWMHEHSHFKYVPVLSEALPADSWSGRTGFVHLAAMRDIPDMSGCQVYACGAAVMVEAARRDFTSQCELPEAEFFCDAFTPAAPSA